jgi:hypothetical protein
MLHRDVIQRSFLSGTATWRIRTMRTITGLFDTHDQAERAVRSLKDAGIAGDDISIIANNSDGSHGTDDDVAEGAGAGAGVGAVVGGTGGLLAGLGMLAIPGVGPVVAGGWLLATAVGALTGAAVGGAAGGLIGALSDAGVPERDAHVYAEGVRRGGILVTARVDESRVDAAAAILRDSSAVDLEARRRDYEADGWERFDADAEPYDADQVRDYRAGLIVPPAMHN